MKRRIRTLLISTLALGSCLWAQDTCPALSVNPSNFNGTSIRPGTFVWFSANFKAQGIPGTGATINFTGSQISFTADQPYVLNVPNAKITFDPNAVCSSISFDTQNNTWVTTVPVNGSDEIFLTGLAFPVPAGFAGVNGKVQGPVTWQGGFTSEVEGITVQWKWGAAVYTVFSLNYNVLSIKPTHGDTCLYFNADHAGTPQGVDTTSGRPFKTFVIGGARGGGGSNWTGSWSGTAQADVCLESEPPWEPPM